MYRIIGQAAVVPYYFLVWYNNKRIVRGFRKAVVPYYFLVWYNKFRKVQWVKTAVVPYYFLVWYNKEEILMQLVAL